MNIEEVSVVADSVTAACAVAGVVVAVALGLKSTKISHETALISKEAVAVARDTQLRGEKDYVAGRADLIATNLNDLIDQVARFRSAIHVFWKPLPRDVLASPEMYELTKGMPASEARELMEQHATFMAQQRHEAEVAVHGTVYQSEAAGTRLIDSLESATHLQVISLGEKLVVETTVSLVKLVSGALYPPYLSLIPDPALSAPKSEGAAQWVLNNLRFDKATDADRTVSAEAKSWITAEVQKDPSLSTAQLADRFLANFAIVRLSEEVARVTDVLHEAAAPSPA
ncbi:hypothetical protein [Arthrobacter sedimenti]|uniref:hypothetical protein n=1 Tax=Arthrobacter sedimenti TaxID=2694931 RepID=UPI000B356525|nr:hypothetical protein [Arthrobacter sedimenti]OUM39534.1 hypothetical protein B8W73_13720 [Arthrobacter agilis]